MSRYSEMIKKYPSKVPTRREDNKFRASSRDKHTQAKLPSGDNGRGIAIQGNAAIITTFSGHRSSKESKSENEGRDDKMDIFVDVS